MKQEETIKALQAQLLILKRKHENLEVTVKTWNEERREIDEKIRNAEQVMLDCRIAAWRMFAETGQQLEMF